MKTLEPKSWNLQARLEVVASLLDNTVAAGPEFSRTVREAIQAIHNKDVTIESLTTDLTFKPFDHYYSYPQDNDLVLARTDDGRMMVWRWSFLINAMKTSTPDHLQFPATGWLSIKALR